MAQTMLKLCEVRARLRDTNLAALARSTGLSHKTLCDVMSERNKNPAYLTIERLSDYLTERVATQKAGGNTPAQP